jgi:hypothetical protein
VHGGAIAALVLGVIGWIPFGLGSALALALGTLALRQIDRHPQEIRGRGLAVAGIVLGALGVGVGCLMLVVVLLGEEDDRPRSAAEAGLDLEVGDCFDNESGLPDDPNELSAARVDEKPCDEPHDAEVYAIVEHPAAADAPFPGDPTLGRFAFDTCSERFEAFVGRDYNSSGLDILFPVPQELSWTKLDDRRVLCSVYDLRSEPLVGTMRNSRR